MTLNYPLALDRFWDLIEISTGRFSLGESRQVNVNGGGHILDASLGSRLWGGEVTLTPIKHQDLVSIEARIELLLEPGASFLAYDKRVTWPLNDPTGVLLGAATPTLSVVDANNVEITIAGLPVGYTLTRGDMIGFSYLTSPVRRALHRVVSVPASADGSGNLVVQVVPAIRPGYTLGAAITLNKPLCKTKVIPGSYKPSTGSPGKVSGGVSFQFTQTLK